MRRLERLNWFDILNYGFITMLCLVMLYPFVNVAAVSLSSYTAFIENPLLIWPKDFNVTAYTDILKHPLLLSSYLNTIIITVCGVVFGLFLYLITGYPLSKINLKGRGFFLVMVLITMLFNGGLIPNFYLMRSLGLLDTLPALVFPSLMSGFSLILIMSFMRSLPEEIEEAARIDGASDPYILFRIVAPLSKPIIATLGLFAAVGYWNNFFNAIIYIRSTDKWPLMLFLKEVIESNKLLEIATGGDQAEWTLESVSTTTLQYATLMIVMLPIIFVYPFIQKYFVKGIMLGSIKG